MPNSPNANSPLALYQQLAQLSNQIIESMRQQQWITAAELCHVYTDILELLKHLPSLTREQQRKRRALLSTILTNDAEIRAILIPHNQIIEYVYSPKKNNTNPMQPRTH
ncbi:MAG TPA: flagellar protein FliT [Paenalcaligenes sp.]|nr:flagellar protein FliT [Paenalcaligenes sp.]